MIEEWADKVKKYQDPIYSFKVRDKEIKIKTHTESLSHSQIPKVSLPKYKSLGRFIEMEFAGKCSWRISIHCRNLSFSKEKGRDPTRMFAGEGGPERTNKRFHYVSMDMPAKRLSTAFDSVTLYGNDPDYRPDIYGKIGNSGVSICCLDDAKKLYSGFDLADAMTSVSMTINGPAAYAVRIFHECSC